MKSRITSKMTILCASVGLMTAVQAGEKLSLLTLKQMSGTTGWKSIKKGKTCEGEPLKLKGKVYKNGLGVHAASEVVYAIPKVPHVLPSQEEFKTGRKDR